MPTNPIPEHALYIPGCADQVIGGKMTHRITSTMLVWDPLLGRWRREFSGGAVLRLLPADAQRGVDATNVGDWELAHAVFHKDELPETQESIAEEAQRLVNGPRQDDYGNPRVNFKRWQAICKAAFNVEVSTKDLVNIMKALKLSRDLQRQKRENKVDYIGYSLLDEQLHPKDFS